MLPNDNALELRNVRQNLSKLPLQDYMSQDESSNNSITGTAEHKNNCFKPSKCTDPAVGKAISDIPLEILSEIFAWCCPTHNDHFRGPPFSALMLSHVCKSWRNTVFQTPNLWTYLTLTVHYSTDGGMEKGYEQLKLWLKRVQNCPILVDMEFAENPRRKQPDNVFYYVKDIIEMTMSYKRSIVSSDMELRAALDATSVSLPIDKITRILEQYSWAKSNMRLDHPLPGSVQIHVNRYAGIIFGLEGHSTLGSHLTHLDLRNTYGRIELSVEECQIAFSNFPQLEYCALHIGESMDEAVDPVTLVHLRTLCLSWSDGVEIAALLDSITAPALGELELNGSLLPREYFPENRWNHLSEFLRRSSPRLWAVSLGKMDCSSLDLMSCLSLCEGLQNLELEDCRLDEEIMNSLQNGGHPHRDRAVRTLMGLDFLALVSCDIFDLDNFLRSSSDQVLWSEMSLSRLYIIDCGHISEDVLAAMSALPLEQFETSSDLLDDESLG